MTHSRHATLAQIARSLADGKVARGSWPRSLARIADPKGEGARAFIHVDAAKVMHAADEQDTLRRAGRAPWPLAGVPFGVKDLFDVAGEVTAAGSKLLASAKPAVADSDAVAALKRPAWWRWAAPT